MVDSKRGVFSTAPITSAKSAKERRRKAKVGKQADSGRKTVPAQGAELGSWEARKLGRGRTDQINRCGVSSMLMSRAGEKLDGCLVLGQLSLDDAGTRRLEAVSSSRRRTTLDSGSERAWEVYQARDLAAMWVRTARTATDIV